MLGSRTLALAALAAIVALSPGFAGQMHPFSVHDMLAMDRISDPRVSPDGQRVVFVLRTTDLVANRGRTDLWLVSIFFTVLGCRAWSNKIVMPSATGPR